MSAELSRAVSDLDADLWRRAAESGSPLSTLERSLGDLVRGAGWKKRSAERMRLLSEALQSRGIRCHTDLKDLKVPVNKVVRFSRVREGGPSADAPSDTRKARIFLSYGRRDATELADRLFLELRKRDLDPWKDEFEIRSGSEWERVIKAGVGESEAMVAILSESSVRTTGTSPVAGDTDSVCLDEIAFARYKSPPTPIVPVKGDDSEPPLSVFRLDHVDMIGWGSPGFDWEPRLEKLFTGLETVRKGQEFFRSASSVLKPTDFDSYLARKRQNFFGRKWLFDSILTRLESHRLLLVVGDPGVGKSAAMAELIHRNFDGRVDAYHFCRADQPSTLRSGAFVRSIAAMLGARHRDYGERLEAGEFRDVLREAESDADPRRALEAGVLEPLNEIVLPEGEYRILVLDSLDEALRLDGQGASPLHPDRELSIVEVLSGQLKIFPDWLRLLATARNEPAAIDPLGFPSKQRLDAGGGDNLEDLRRYIRNRTGSGILEDKLLRAQRAGVDLIEEISKAAKGNFLYAALALDALETGRLDVATLRKMPVGLGEQYDQFFSRRFRSREGFKRVRSVLECLVAGQSPIPEVDLALAAGIDADYELPELLEELSEFLRIRESEKDGRRFSLFHKSLADWLGNPERKGKAFSARAMSGHRALAGALWTRFESAPKRLSRYALVHLPDHLSILVQGDGGAATDLEVADRLVRFVLDDGIQDLRADDPQGIRRSIVAALHATVGAADVRATPGAVTAAVGLPVFDSRRLDPQRLFSLAASGEVKQLRGDLELYPLDAAWRGSILVALAWAEVVRNRGLAKALRDEAASHIPESEPELVRLDEHLASGTVEDRIAMEPTESRIVALLAQVGGAPIGEHLTEEIYQLAEELHARQAEYSAENITEGATERRASHAELFAAEFVAFAARSPASGDRYLDSYIDRHAQNTYRHYRRSALRTILRAVLDHPESEWIGKRLTAIVEAELTASSPEFTECSPAALASLRHPAEFDQYTDDARRAASELPENPERGEGDTWGSRKRRLGAAAEGRSRGRDDVQGAKQLLQEGLKIPYGFAGFQAPACLSFAESIRIADPDPGTLIDDALQAARDAAHNIFEQTFAIRMTSRCNAIIEDWWPHIPDIDKVIDRFTADPSQPEFSALHIVGGSFAGRRPDAEEIPYALQQDRPSLADLALAFDQPTGETRRLNPGLPGTGGLSQGTRVRIPDPEFPPMLASRLAAEALVTLPDLHRKVLAIRKLLPIATDNITMLDLVISRLIHAIAALQDGAALLDTIEPVLATWFPRLPDPKASAKDLLAAMASSQPASVNSRD